jgi:hypothetical protein
VTTVGVDVGVVADAVSWIATAPAVPTTAIISPKPSEHRPTANLIIRQLLRRSTHREVIRSTGRRFSITVNSFLPESRKGNAPKRTLIDVAVISGI